MPWGIARDVIRNLSIPLGEGIVGRPRPQREPVLVPDVQADPRYLPTSDIVRCELSVPMIARGRLVGVIDVQSTRLGAFSDYDRTHAEADRRRAWPRRSTTRSFTGARSGSTGRCARCRGFRTNFRRFWISTNCFRRLRQACAGLINYDAFSILLVDAEQKALRHRFSLRYDERVNIDNIPLGKGITGAAATSGGDCARARYGARTRGISRRIREFGLRLPCRLRCRT